MISRLLPDSVSELPDDGSRDFKSELLISYDEHLIEFDY
jgi:hypothetical protein